ncbi:MAG: radical SAM protein [Bacillaceae bacterium]
MQVLETPNQQTTKPPRLIFWELTERCNLKCIHCRATAQPNRNPEELTYEEICKTIDNIASFTNPILVLTGGEPLCRPDIFDIASYACQKGITTTLATNGTLITDDIAKQLKEIGIKRAAISFDGPTSAIHDNFRGIPGSFEEAIRGAKLIKKHGIELQINTTITKHNVAFLEDIIELAHQLNVNALHLFMLVPVGCGVQITESNMLSAEKYEEVLHWFYERSREVPFEIRATCAPHYYRIMAQEITKRGERFVRNKQGMHALTKGCLAGTGVCFISHKGNVQPCGYLPVFAGNIRQTPLSEIWNNAPLFQTLRDTSQLEGKCSYCEFVNICSGCRARAFYESGSYLTEEPYCLYEPTQR